MCECGENRSPCLKKIIFSNEMIILHMLLPLPKNSCNNSYDLTGENKFLFFEVHFHTAWAVFSEGRLLFANPGTISMHP